MSDENEKYDETTVYQKEIEPHIKEILLICDDYHIPAFMTFAVKNTAKETEYKSEILSPTYEGRNLKDDKLSKHALVMNGFEVVPDKKGMLDDLSE